MLPQRERAFIYRAIKLTGGGEEQRRAKIR